MSIKKGKKRIAHVVYSFDKIGGLENGIVNLCNQLNSKKFFHYIISLTNVGSLRHRVIVNNIEYYSLTKSEGNDFTLPFKLARIFKREKIDIVHLRNWPTMVEGYIASRIAGIKNTIYSEHGRHFEDIWQGKIIVSMIHRYILNNVDVPLCVSHTVAEEMSRLYKMSQVVKVIVNGVDTAKFRPRDQEVCRARCNLPVEEVIIGSVGRLVEGKNYDQLIKDFLKSFQKGILVIGGDGPERDKLTEIIRISKAQNRIRLIGHSDNVNELLNCFNVFISSSASEGLSNVLLEAMSCGLPVVAYDVGGNRELIDHQQGGVLVPLGSRDKLMKAVKLLVEQQKTAEVMSLHNRNKILQSFSIEHMVERYSRMYDKCT